jgi:hypothetical protein
MYVCVVLFFEIGRMLDACSFLMFGERIRQGLEEYIWLPQLCGYIPLWLASPIGVGRLEPKYQRFSSLDILHCFHKKDHDWFVIRIMIDYWLGGFPKNKDDSLLRVNHTMKSHREITWLPSSSRPHTTDALWMILVTKMMNSSSFHKSEDDISKNLEENE